MLKYTLKLMNNVKERGLLITLEGLDRAGKTTQAQLLNEHYNKNGKNSKIVRFPGYFYFIIYFFIHFFLFIFV